MRSRAPRSPVHQQLQPVQHGACCTGTRGGDHTVVPFCFGFFNTTHGEHMMRKHMTVALMALLVLARLAGTMDVDHNNIETGRVLIRTEATS